MALTYSKMLDLGTKIPDFELSNVVDDFLAGKEVSEKQFPSLGCNIKWR